MGDHQSGEAILGNDLLCHLQYLAGGGRVQGGGVLIQQKQLGAGDGGHEQGRRLPLAAAERADLGVEAILQPHAALCKHLAISGNAGAAKETGAGRDSVAADQLQRQEENTGAVQGSDSAASQTGNGSGGLQEEPDAKHKVYLTFDDGPGANTEKILDILDEYQVKATFFVVGKDTETERTLLREIVDRGHTLGMHSYSHKYTELYASTEAFAQDFTRQRDYLEEVTGVESVIYRFPGGSSNTVSTLNMQLFADYLDSEGVRFFDWNVSSGDGGSVLLPAETITKNVLTGVKGKSASIVLMHDSAEKSTTVEALPAILDGLSTMEDTVILPITDATEPVQHIHRGADAAGTDEGTIGGTESNGVFLGSERGSVSGGQ